MTEALQRRAHELALSLREHVKELEKQRKALELLADPKAWTDRASRERAAKAVAMTVEAPALAAFAAELTQGLRAWASEQRRVFVDRFLALVAERGGTAEPVGQQPPVFDLAGIQIEVDYDKEEARLSYGREDLGSCALDPETILRARDEHALRLERAWPGAAVFFDAFASAYRARLGRENKPPQERVALTDLLPELGLEGELRRLEAPISDKASFAYCLDRLAREGGLEKDGYRIELGTATGGSTKDKKRVLFLRHGLGGGQYYLTARVGSLR